MQSNTSDGMLCSRTFCVCLIRNVLLSILRLTCCMCYATGASVASYFLLPKATVSLGASGAVFGLFAVSVLVKLSFNLKKLIECGILGQFVIKQLLQVWTLDRVVTSAR